MTRSFPKGFWKGLFIIFAAYTIIQVAKHYSLFGKIYSEGLGEQITRWMSITVIYITGGWVLQRSKIKWMVSVWHLIHLVLIGYLFALAGWDFLISPIPYGLRASVAPIVEFLISPTLYLGSGVLFYSLSNQYSE